MERKKESSPGDCHLVGKERVQSWSLPSAEERKEAVIAYILGGGEGRGEGEGSSPRSHHLSGKELFKC